MINFKLNFKFSHFYSISMFVLLHNQYSKYLYIISRFIFIDLAFLITEHNFFTMPTAWQIISSPKLVGMTVKARTFATLTRELASSPPPTSGTYKTITETLTLKLRTRRLHSILLLLLISSQRCETYISFPIDVITFKLIIHTNNAYVRFIQGTYTNIARHLHLYLHHIAVVWRLLRIASKYLPRSCM